MANRATGVVKIVQVPVGNAPEWVRQVWLGLELPCFPVAGLLGFRQEKEIRGEPMNCGRSRYVVVVPQDEALKILEAKNSKAADWWKSQGFPKTSGDKYFCFGESEVEFISGVKYQKIEQFLGILEVGR